MKFTTITVTNLDNLRIRPMCFTFSKSSVNNMSGVHPDMIMIYMESIKVSPIDFGVPKDGGLRLAARQKEMLDDPDIETKCDGYINISNHQAKKDGLGYALDFYAYINKRASWDKIHLAIIAGVIMSTATRLLKEGKISIKIKWGGEFGSNSFHGWDYPHTEVVLIK